MTEHITYLSIKSFLRLVTTAPRFNNSTLVHKLSILHSFLSYCLLFNTSYYTSAIFRCAICVSTHLSRLRLPRALARLSDWGHRLPFPFLNFPPIQCWNCEII